MALSLCLSFYFLGFLVLAIEVTSVSTNHSSYEIGNNNMVMEEDELSGLFDVLGSLLDDPQYWAKMHPQPCTDTPWPGLQCEIDDDGIFHVTKIHFGPDIVNPPCKPSAHLSNSLHKLHYLKFLSIFNCFLTSPVILSSVTSFVSLSSSLEHLALDSNPSLVGKIPTSLGQVKSLRVLSLSQNSLQGNFPDELGNLENLQELDLSYNNISGEIPEKIGGLKSLNILDLSWNNLQGQVPCSLSHLQNLQKIDLTSNKLIGMIPSDLGFLKRLVLLDLSHNYINGPIPETFSGLQQLQYLIVDHNPINSGIPLFLGSLKKLKSISFSGCGLTGEIPNSLSLLKNLTALSLDNNSLIGTVPSRLGLLQNLDLLNLSNNQLSGELLLAEEFISRIGQRLDVRGNNGLCASQEMYKKKMKNVSVNLDNCLGKMDNIGQHIFKENPNQNESKGLQSSSSSSFSKYISNFCLSVNLLYIFFFIQ
ncbi:receptor like protein 29-like [Mercurialis annua]|uniref:receptor like protein 29-like n=1 Tax=Mercurialis annua TaxID=3986 RepID=UPI0024ACCD3E|nr:receptor like protein 29-like [Mercurialis annua]